MKLLDERLGCVRRGMFSNQCAHCSATD
jgi:hypothetical protein